MAWNLNVQFCQYVQAVDVCYVGKGVIETGGGGLGIGLWVGKSENNI